MSPPRCRGHFGLPGGKAALFGVGIFFSVDYWHGLSPVEPPLYLTGRPFGGTAQRLGSHGHLSTSLLMHRRWLDPVFVLAPFVKAGHAK